MREGEEGEGFEIVKNKRKELGEGLGRVEGTGSAEINLKQREEMMRGQEIIKEKMNRE